MAWGALPCLMSHNLAFRDMKIQLDQNGNSAHSLSATSRARGILITRKGKRLTVDIGNRVTPHALFAALSHIRSMSHAIMITSNKAAITEQIPPENNLTATDACFYLSQLLIQQVESRHDLYMTKELCFLTQEHLTSLPVAMHHLCDMRLYRLETAAALAMLDEAAMANMSFIVPGAAMSFSDFNYQVKKLPTMLRWPSDEPYLPLAFSQLLTAPYAPWYNSLCHAALSIRRPLLQRAQMKITLKDGAPAEPAITNDEIDPLADIITALPSSAQWHNITRILYPLASQYEKPSHFRLLICTIIDETTDIIL